MIKSEKYFLKISLFLAFFAAIISFAGENSFAQTRVQKPKPKPGESKAARETVDPNLLTSSKITQISAEQLKNLLKPNGKPLLINFWATWCEPCREEFPDLVKIDADFGGKIDVITVSLDDPVEISRAVPKFLAEMKAEMPTYLLKTDDETAAIAAVSKTWKGGLPYTILINAQGKIVYSHQEKFKLETLQAEIEKLFE